MRQNGIDPTEGHHVCNVVAVVLRWQRPTLRIKADYSEQEESFRLIFTFIGFQALPRSIILVLFLQRECLTAEPAAEPSLLCILIPSSLLVIPPVQFNLPCLFLRLELYHWLLCFSNNYQENTTGLCFKLFLLSQAETYFSYKQKPIPHIVYKMHLVFNLSPLK